MLLRVHAEGRAFDEAVLWLLRLGHTEHLRRLPGHTRKILGVWVQRQDKGAEHEDKIAAIGIRIKRWVTLHGIALNIDCDLSHYAGIVPCGVSDPRHAVTSLADLGVEVTLGEVDAVLRREFEQLFGAVDDG